MPRRARGAPGGLTYHVLDRGVGRMRLFDDEGDHLTFERVLAESLERHPPPEAGGAAGVLRHARFRGH